MTLRYVLTLLLASLTTTLLTLPAQTVIDATGAVRARTRNPTSGRGGGAGRKLPLQIALELSPPSSEPEGRSKVTFVLTNIGQKDIVIPNSPHPGDFEPKDKSQSYGVQHLHLYLTSNTSEGSALPGGAHLYGNVDHPATLLTLAPAQSVQIIVSVRISREGTAAGTTSLIGHAALTTETLKTADDQTSVDSEETGSATSPPYRMKGDQ